MPDNKWENMRNIAQRDLEALKKAEESYGNSWRRRGGVGAFMMLARKFDRIEHQATKHGWDIFRAGEVYKGEAGLLDDIRDLRRYLILVENDILVNTVFQKAEELSDSADYQRSKLMSKLTTKSVKKDGKEK